MATSKITKTVPLSTKGGFSWGPDAPNNATIDYQRIKQHGNVVSIHIYFHCTGDINANGIILGNIYGVPLPPSTLRFIASTSTVLWDATNIAYAALDASTGEIILKAHNTTDNYGLINLEYIAEQE